MAGCTCENWSLQDLSNALQDMHKDNKRIVVPMFQRGKRWSKDQEKVFIDSLIKGYPVGTMLFYEKFEDDKRTYILVDGLQRGNSIKKYMTNPTEFFYDKSISDEMCQKVLDLVNESENTAMYSKVRNILTSFIKSQKTFKNIQYFSVAKQIADEFKAGFEPIERLIEVIKDFFEERQNLYDKIANTVIPVIVYTGDENTLPEIFDRINSKGTPLDQYEVYAAAWPVNKKFSVNNSDIIEHIIRKYDAFEEDNFKIYGYSREELRTSRQINAFEYLFGLSKHLVLKYDILSFNKSLADDTVNPLAFELVNACLNDTDRIKTLYKNLYELDINAFEQALYKVIDFVKDSILVITKFKGNTRNANKIFHSKYQILSMISTTFREMWNGTDFSKVSPTWQERKKIIAKNLIHYYVYDIITNYWSEGGTNKIHSASKPNRYLNAISSRAWMAALDGYYELSMLRSEKSKVPNPKSEDYVILNCIYLKTFTAMDQLSIDKFDVEHIATKNQMRKLIDSCDGEGLPISCIANLCYLPDYVNRSKGAKNFYQDKKYLQLQHIDISEIENKYSFTEKEDLEWMDMPYETADDFSVLKEYYVDYCTKRFKRIKMLFCEALDIEYKDIDIEKPQTAIVVPKPKTSKTAPKTTESSGPVEKLADMLGCSLLKVSRSCYKTEDGKSGFAIATSKAYKQGKKEKYWFAYRRKSLDGIADCDERYAVYCCKDESVMIILPIDTVEEHLENLNVSKDEESGEISHWHIVFLKESSGKMNWLLSRPEIDLVDITKYVNNISGLSAPEKKTD